MPYYWLYEFNHAALSPARAVADATRLYYRNPLNPASHTTAGKSVAAWCEVFERVTRRYGKPEFGIDEVTVSGERVTVTERVVWQRPFCRLINFEKGGTRTGGLRKEPKLLIVAPMSGHYATLLRGTVEDMLPNHDVYITDWVDARMVPLAAGSFDLDDYIDYVINMLHIMGGNTHVMAVCQPSVPVLAAVSLMGERKDPYAPLSMTLMGGPIDTRESPTAVNKLAEGRDLDWFKRNVITRVPFPHPGFMREVYPGFLQLSGFMTMKLDRHMAAHRDLFMHLIEGDGDSAEKHRDFYDEYLAVMDLTAEFYLQTVETVFITHALPKGEFVHRGTVIDPSKIKKTALMTVEGEKDDISGIGQTKAAHALCTELPDEKRVHYMQPRVGHYGVFNGSRFRAEIAPRIADFILSNDPDVRKARDTRGRGAGGSLTASIAQTAGRLAAAVAGTGNRPAAANGKARVADAIQAPSLIDGPFLDAPNGATDDLKAITGIGPKLEQTLNSLGVFHYWQIAQWSEEDIAEVDERLSFKGRIERDDWVQQAKKLTEGSEA